MPPSRQKELKGRMMKTDRKVLNGTTEKKEQSIGTTEKRIQFWFKPLSQGCSMEEDGGLN